MNARRNRSLTPAERIDWLRLIRSENVGPITFFQLLQRYGSAGAALQALPELAARAGRRQRLRVATRSAAEREIEQSQRLGAALVARGEPGYPEPLAAIADPPPLIAVRGDTQAILRRQVGVVGARNASGNGRSFTRRLASDLGAQDFCVVSGMARGIDTAAHEGALDTGTVAVLAAGIDVVYPKENRALYEGIVARGAVVAENPPGSEPLARHFPRRNRIIAGLSLGVCVVEAAARSGSLITARLALEQGREVFAVPGSPLDPRCRGTNDLIRNGAVLTESAVDILHALSGIAGRSIDEPEPSDTYDSPASEPGPKELDAARRAINERLSPTPVAVDELIRQCHLTAAVVWAVLLELEIGGRLERHPGNRVALIAAA